MTRDTPAKQQFKTLHTETSTRRRKLEEQLEILRADKKREQILFYEVTKFKSEKLFGLVIDGNKRNTLSQ